MLSVSGGYLSILVNLRIFIMRGNRGCGCVGGGAGGVCAPSSAYHVSNFLLSEEL